MRSDELYKFYYKMLSSVRHVLHDIASNLEMDYLPERHWSNLEMKRSRIMVKAIDKLLFKRSQNWRDLPTDTPLDSVEVLKYEKRSKSKNKGKVPTEMKLVLEQTQQGSSYEVLVSAEGVEELKRKVKIKGEKKEALLTLTQKLGSIYTDQRGTVVIATVFDEVFLMVAAAGHGRQQSVNVKELQDKRILKAFKLSYQEKYEHVGPKSQDHKMARLQDNVKRLCLVDDLKNFKITFYLVKDTSRSLKVKRSLQHITSS
ncbi:hypothetical protein Tco_0098912 [Tanacetum coccineum]